EHHLCKDLLAPAATSEFKTMASIIDTALSKLLSFMDSEIEQMICFDSEIDIEEFSKGKQAVFLVIDEKMGTRNFMVSLIYRQFYGELIQTTDMLKGNRLEKRVNFFMDEIGTHNPIEGLDEVFSAARSRNIICMPFIQTTAQLQDKYGREKAKVIEANCQNLLFSFLSPLSDDANRFEKVLGNQTVQSGSVSHKSGNTNSNSSTTYSMIKRPLMFSDEMTSDLEKGNWVLKHTGMKPARMKLLKHEDWGITFNSEYEIESKADRSVKYASRAELMTEIQKKYVHHFYPTANTSSETPISHSAENEQLRIDPEYFN
ncbi:MAG: type IV secretory system conjugative DNA transfer family protein, partial [Ruminococcus sp.]|nr:type IV secretory system conjugative DNA transfer family protein [Ruminococcus sp.]